MNSAPELLLFVKIIYKRLQSDLLAKENMVDIIDTTGIEFYGQTR